MSSRLSKESILNNLLIRLGVAGIFLYETIQSLFIPPYSLNLLLKQILFVGARSILVIIIAGLFDVRDLSMRKCNILCEEAILWCY